MKKVLVVEDNEDNLRLITMALTRAGYEVVAAKTGEEGVRIMAGGAKPRFIIMDINLPGIDGIEAARRMQAVRETAQIPIIAVTSHAMIGDRERIMGAGFRGYFEKPIDPVAIAGRIRDILGNEA